MSDEAVPGSAPTGRRGCLLYLLLFFGVAAVLLGTPFVVGSFLPERYEARTRLRLSSSPEKVFDAVCDVKRNPMTGGLMQRIEELASEEGLPRWREETTNSDVTVRTLELVRPRVVRRAMSDSVVPMTAESEIEIEAAAGGGSIITARSVTTIRSGTWHVPVFRFMMTIFGGAQASLEGYWLHLARQLDDKVTFDKVAAVAPTATATTVAPTATAGPKLP